jgi:hypothetical protein
MHFFMFLYFLDNEYILISSRYQLHSASTTTRCPCDIADVHNQIKEEIIKKKSYYSDQFLVVIVVQTLLGQHQKSSFSNSDASKKETMYTHHRCSIIDHIFSPWRKFSLTNNAFNKVIAKHNQLRPNLGFLPCKGRTLSFSCLVATLPMLLLRVMKHQENSSHHKDSNHNY